MKITDFAIIFAILLISVGVSIDLNNKKSWNRTVKYTLLNNICDEAVTAALDKAYLYDNGNKPYIDYQRIDDYLFNDVAAGIYDSTTKMELNKSMSLVKALIYYEPDGVYAFINNTWKTIKVYDEKMVSHEQRVYDINEYINKQINASTIHIPMNNGEEYCRSIEDYGIIVLFSDYECSFVSGSALIM